MIYPDINRSGTPVLSIPANLNFKFMYGSRSFQKHISQIESLNAGIKIVEDFNWSFDLDTKFDLLKYYDLSENLEK